MKKRFHSSFLSLKNDTTASFEKGRTLVTQRSESVSSLLMKLCRSVLRAALLIWVAKHPLVMSIAKMLKGAGLEWAKDMRDGAEKVVAAIAQREKGL